MSRKAGNPSEQQILLDDPSYFKSPVDTILNTLCDDAFEHTSMYDLMDAYITLSFRIQAAAGLLTLANVGHLSLRIMKEHSVSLGRCMQRDIRRAFADPLASNAHVANPGMSSSIRTSTLSQESINTVKCTSALCLYSLQVVSNIFSLPALHRLFPQSALKQLLHDVLIIARSPELPTPNSDKTRTLAAWVFSTLQLPTAIVTTHSQPIQEWLNDIPPAFATQPHACSIIHNLLSRYPDAFFCKSITLVPEILPGLTSSVESTRMHATTALAGYALARVSVRSAASHAALTDLSTAVHRFMRAQLPRSHTTRTHHTSTLLPDYIARSVQDLPQSAEGQEVRWAIAVICCLTVLSGQGIFNGTRPMKLVLGTVERVVRCGTAPMINLAACVWKCIVWSFLQMLNDEPNSDPVKDGSIDPKEGIFGVVKQEPRGGTGASFVAGLLYHVSGQGTPTSDPRSHRNLRWALVVLKDLISHRSKAVYHDGLALLGRLTSGIGASAEGATALTDEKRWHPDDIVVKALFSRNVLNFDERTFNAALDAASRFDPSVVRPLSEVEIVDHWGTLVEIWTVAVERELRTSGPTFSLPDVLARTWQALLLTQTQLTQEHGHLTANPEFTVKAVSNVAHFLEWKRSPDVEPPGNDTQRRVLCLCYQLWMIMRHVFSEAWLSSAAGSLLTSVLQNTFDLSDDSVKIAWSELCSALICASAPVLMARLAIEDEEHRLVDVRRELWRVAARQWTSMRPVPGWEESVDFLVLPLKHWPIDDEELSAWTAILDHVITHSARSTFSVVDILVQRIPEDVAAARFLETPAIAEHLLSRVELTHRLEDPSRFLRCINTLLCGLYSDTPEHISTATRLLRHLRRVLKASPPDVLVDALSALSNGLALWIADQSEYMLVEEYNDAVIPIYCDALAALHDTTIIAETLHALAHFFYSAFVRMPPPCHGPIAFYEFWTHKAPSLKHLRGSYPEEIKTALRGCRTVFGSTSSQDHSFDTESLSGSQAELSSPVKSEQSTPTLERKRLLDRETTPTRRRPSPILSPEVPYDPPSSRQLRSSARKTRASASRRHDESSDYMPSSPTDALRARRLAMRPASRVAHEKPARPADRPLKRRRVDDSPRTPTTTSPLSYANSSGPSGSKGKNVSVRVPRRSDYRVSSPGLTPAKSKGKGVTSRHGSSSPVRADPSALPSSDDYDAWEAPLCDVQDLSDEIPDSQPSDADDDDSLLPIYMKTGRHDQDAYERAHSEATMLLDADDLADIPGVPTQGQHTLGKRTRPGGSPTAMRMHTAPAGLHPEHSESPSDSAAPIPHAAPVLRRAHTTSAHLDELRNVYDALREDGSQLGVGEIAAAAEMTSRLGALLSEKLTRRLRSDSKHGEGSSGGGGHE